MTTLANNLPNPISRWARRTLQTWHTMFVQGDITTLIVALALLIMPALALNAAGWPLAMNTIIPVIILSVLFGFLLSRSYYNELLALFMSAIYGICFVLLIASINEPGNLGEGAYSVFSRLFHWIVDASSGGINQDDLVFTLLVAGLFWFLGYNIAWHIFRVDRVWRAILPPALILTTNSVYYSGSVDLNRYLIGFVFLSLLLVVRSNLDAREWNWYVNGIRVPRRLRQQFFSMGIVLSIVVMLIAWGLPTANLQDRLNRFQDFLQAAPLTQISEFWNRLFSSIETQGPTTTDYYGGDSLELGGAIKLGNQTVFIVNAPLGHRYYWRSRVFDIYDAGRWTSAADTRLTDPEVPLDIVYDPAMMGGRTQVEQTFTMGLSASRIIYAAPQPIRVDLPTRTDLRYGPAPVSSMNVSVIRPLKVMYRGDKYTVTSLVSSATASELRQAGSDYPQWIKDLYLPYSPSITPRTIQLAQQIVNEANATNPYDQAHAIETWLRQNIAYNESIPEPPSGRDPVDWLLFDEKQGYCNYYASAMVVMLRSLGVPTRMGAGFAQGEYSDKEQGFVVRERDAHTWVEAFFPGFGWIEFEPTAAQAPIDRGDNNNQTQMQATVPPKPSPTPTFTPSPTPTVTAAPPTKPPQPESNELPTVTPSATPTPTATPVIVPTEPPPLPPPDSPLSFLLPALGIALLGLLLIVVIIGIGYFIYWYWEWRGLKGLSPITRAYARLERYLGLIGIRLAEQETPEERRTRIVRSLPAAEPPVSAITRLYTSERYGPATPGRAPDGRQIDAVARALLRARGRILNRYIRRWIPFVKKD